MDEARAALEGLVARGRKREHESNRTANDEPLLPPPPPPQRRGDGGAGGGAAAAGLPLYRQLQAAEAARAGGGGGGGGEPILFSRDDDDRVPAPRPRPGSSTSSSAQVPPFAMRRPPPCEAAGWVVEEQDDTDAHDPDRVIHSVPVPNAAHLLDPRAPPLALAPARRQLQPVERGPWPHVAPAIMRLVDDSMARVFADELRVLQAKEAQAAAAKARGEDQEEEQEQEEQEGQGDGKAFSITLGELARRTPPPVDEGAPAAARARQRRRRDEWFWVKHCMGREAERVLDAMIRDDLVQKRQQLAARRAAAASEARRRAAGTKAEEEGLIDWKDVLEFGETRAREKAAMDAERAKPVSAAALGRGRKDAYNQAFGRKKGAGGCGGGGGGGKAATATTTTAGAYEPDWRVLEPALDPGVLARTRAELEKYFGPAEKQLQQKK